MSGFCVVLATYPTRREALKAAEILVSEKLAACVNVIPSVRSVYRWKGKLERSGEALAVIKSRKRLFAKLSRRIKTLHSYATPEIVMVPIEAGFGPYLAWLRESTR